MPIHAIGTAPGDPPRRLHLPVATVIGDVRIGAHSGEWPGAVRRDDFGVHGRRHPCGDQSGPLNPDVIETMARAYVDNTAGWTCRAWLASDPGRRQIPMRCASSSRW